MRMNGRRRLQDFRKHENWNIRLKLREFFTHFYLAMEWRIIATFITFVAAYLVSGSVKVSLGIAGVEGVAKIVVQSFWLQHRVKKHHLNGIQRLPNKNHENR